MYPLSREESTAMVLLARVLAIDAGWWMNDSRNSAAFSFGGRAGALTG
jgi:hypothetical protein